MSTKTFSKSIVQDVKECWVCHTWKNLECHHIYFGVVNRRRSEEYGLKVWLCAEHHRGSHGVHGYYGNELDNRLKQLGQLRFQKVYPDKDFKEIFGRNYI